MDISRIAFEKLQNTRDLGQFTTTEGQKIKPRRLLRSGSLNDLNLEDRAILQNDYQLRTVIDFRTQTERDGEPDSKIAHVEYHWIPILDEDTIGISQDECNTMDGLAQLAAFLMRDNFDVKQYMIETYRHLVASEYCRAQYRKFFDILLTASDEGALLWHCSAGKDRAGIASVFVLYALGVDPAVIEEDYLATNTFYSETLNKLIAVLTEKAGTKDIIPKVYDFFSVAPDYLETVLGVIRTDFGGMDAFLEHEMGLTAEKRQALQDKFLVPLEQ